MLNSARDVGFGTPTQIATGLFEFGFRRLVPCLLRPSRSSRYGSLKRFGPSRRNLAANYFPADSVFLEQPVEVVGKFLLSAQQGQMSVYCLTKCHRCGTTRSPGGAESLRL